MAGRTFTVRANFPVQGTDLVETVTATSWPAALGAAARQMKRRMKGRRIKAASFTIEQQEQGEQQAQEQEQGATEQLPLEQAEAPAAAIPGDGEQVS